MARLLRSLSIATAVLVLVGAATLLGWILWNIFRDLTGQTALTMAIATVTIGVTVWTFVKTKEKEIDSRLFPEKAKVYTEILEIIKQFTSSDKPWHTPMHENDMAKRLMDVQFKMLVWSSPKAIKAFNSLGDLSEADLGEMIARIAFLYGCIRRDLGHNDKAMDCVNMATQMIIPNERNEAKNAAVQSKFYNEVVAKEFSKA